MTRTVLPLVDKGVEDFQEVFDIVEVESRGGFVEDVEGISCGGPDKFFGQFDPLGFAPG